MPSARDRVAGVRQHQPERAEVGAPVGVEAPEDLPLLEPGQPGRQVGHRPGDRGGTGGQRELAHAIVVARPPPGSGPSRNSGYSLVAAPSPISTPVSTGRSRDHAHRAPATIATAIRSQLTSPVSSRAGESTKYSASQGRPRWVPARNQVASSPKSAQQQRGDQEVVVHLGRHPRQGPDGVRVGVAALLDRGSDGVELGELRGAPGEVGDADGVLGDLVAAAGVGVGPPPLGVPPPGVEVGHVGVAHLAVAGLVAGPVASAGRARGAPARERRPPRTAPAARAPAPTIGAAERAAPPDRRSPRSSCVRTGRSGWARRSRPRDRPRPPPARRVAPGRRHRAAVGSRLVRPAPSSGAAVRRRRASLGRRSACRRLRRRPACCSPGVLGFSALLGRLRRRRRRRVRRVARRPGPRRRRRRARGSPPPRRPPSAPT